MRVTCIPEYSTYVCIVTSHMPSAKSIRELVDVYQIPPANPFNLVCAVHPYPVSFFVVGIASIQNSYILSIKRSRFG